MENKNVIEAKERIEFLKKENVELNNFLNENRSIFKKWLEENFNKTNIDSNSIEIEDDEFYFKYSIEDNMLKMKKGSKMNFRPFGFGHPMEFMYDFMEMKEKQASEVIYEGGYVPKRKESNLFPILKEDLINNGEISTKIKKYIHDDRKLRVEKSDKISDNDREIRKLESEMRQIFKKALEDDFKGEKLTELFKNKTVLVNGEKYNFLIYNCNHVESICFKKETNDKYYLEFVYPDGDEELLKINKKDFNINRYINY